MVTIVAYFTVKPDVLEQVKDLSHKMQELSRQEPGCRAYVAHQAVEDPLRWCFYEVYDNEAAIEAHRASPHFAEYVVKGLLKIIDNPTREYFVPLT
jgi:quinol monooxygenase YgiN